MDFMTIEMFNQELERLGEQKFRRKYWRHRLAPGYTVADQLAVQKFFSELSGLKSHRRLYV